MMVPPTASPTVFPTCTATVVAFEQKGLFAGRVKGYVWMVEKKILYSKNTLKHAKILGTIVRLPLF